MENKNIDWKGNEVSYVVTNGFANNRQHERQTHDYYATEPKAVSLLMELEKWDKNIPIWECASGENHLADELKRIGYTNIICSDLIDRTGTTEIIDFLEFDKKELNLNILTNPPYIKGSEFIEKALSIINDGYKVAMFFPIRYLEGKARKKLFEKYPPKTIYVSSGRIKCAINGQFDKMTGSAMSYAWFVWEKGYKGETILKWFN